MMGSNVMSAKVENGPRCINVYLSRNVLIEVSVKTILLFLE